MSTLLNFPATPSPGTTYNAGGATWLWDGAKWTTGAASNADVVNSAAVGNTGRNLIHNGRFDIQQRGAGPFSVVGYTLDRWRLELSADSCIVQPSPLNDAQRTAIGDESATWGMWANVAGNAGAGAFTAVSQFMEDVRRLAGKTVTVSFWGYVVSGTAKVGVSAQQYFGTGGSPSATVSVNGTSVTLTTTPTRVSVTFTYPSIVGKTVGTNNDHFSRLALFFSSGATNNAFAGGIGVQIANFVLWGVQLEVGSVATPLAKRDIADELALCQRFYQLGQIVLEAYSVAGGAMQASTAPRVEMRATPILSQTSSSGYNTGAVTLTGNTMRFNASAVLSATGGAAINVAFTATADL